MGSIGVCVCACVRVCTRVRRLLHILDDRPSGKLFIDVGANVGTFTRAVLDLWSPASVRIQLAAAGERLYV